MALGLEPGLGPRFRGDRAGGGMSGADLTRLRAKWRTTAMLWAPGPFRRRDWSSANTTSSTQCRLWRVGRRSFTSGLSQNGAGASRLTPLPPSSLSASFGMSNGFVAAKVSSCCPLDVDDNRLAQPLCSGRMTGLHRSYGLVRPCAPPWYARLVVVATWTSPLASERQGPAVPHESPDQTRASSTPVAIRPVPSCPAD